MSTTQIEVTKCPQCHEKGKSVKEVTLRSLLKEAEQERIEGGYLYCGTETCPVVYFGRNGQGVFEKGALKVRVGVKEEEAPRPVCYCFNHSVEEIEKEIAETGGTTVLDDIKTRMQEGCWCETKNPQGSCCLGTVTRYVKRAKVGSTGPDVDATVVADIQGNRTQKWVWAGSVGSAVLSSACCWLPLLLLGFGVSAGTISATFEHYRPLFIVMTLGFLGGAFYLTYRPGQIAEPDCCGTEKKVPMMQRVNRISLWVVTVIALGFMFFPNYLPVLQGSNESEFSELEKLANIQILSVNVEGMTCEACAVGLEKKLMTLPGAVAAQVDYEGKTAGVAVRTGRSITQIEVTKAVEAAGYKVGKSED